MNIVGYSSVFKYSISKTGKSPHFISNVNQCFLFSTDAVRRKEIF